MRAALRAWLLLGCGQVLCAQQGDRSNDPQTPLPVDLVVPPAIVRSPAEELATFRLPPGFEAQLVAAEPLVGDPIAAVFDAAWRLWVVEMRGFMNDVDATGEGAPVGVVAVLRDLDGDGTMDERRVFLDGLVLPRAVLPLRGGALVIEPPNLLWCPDADGDGRADGKQVVMGGFEAGLANPEHSGNGLLWALDQRIHLANDKRLVRWTTSGFVVEAGAGGGQWGITQDDRGRCYFNYNEDWLRCDLVPGRYAHLAGERGGLPGTNHRLLQDTSVWPNRITPGVNRGYQKGRLVDYRLAIQTAVCGPYVQRGDLLPGCDGDAFVCEPAGNVVRRIVFADHDGPMRGANVYQRERAEFLSSTDERFRPVNLFGGPEGALYVVDLYRGVLQHKNFVTTFLRQQILQRGLERPIGLGRIWRIVPTWTRLPKAPSLHDAPVAELVAALARPEGAVRDVALRELVQRQLVGAAPALRAALRDHARPGCRVGLLAALAGLQVLTATDLRYALHDQDPGVLSFALQHVAPFLQQGDGLLWAQLEVRLPAVPAAVAWHGALALGELLAAGPAPRQQARALALLAALVQRPGDDPTLRAHIALAAGPVLPRLLETVVHDAAAASPPNRALWLRELATAVLRSRRAADQERVFALAAAGAHEVALPLLQGAIAALPKGAARAGWLSFPTTPPALQSLRQGAAVDLAGLASELLAAVALTAGAAPAAPTAALTVAEQDQLVAGSKVYAVACAACHQLDGNGMAGLAPPLRESEWAQGPAARVARIVLHGLRGPLEVAGTPWNLEMPGQGHLADAELAAVLSYVRRSFGNQAPALTAAEITAIRRALAARKEPWTAQELLGIR